MGKKDRFAFSVLLEVTPAGEILNADFCKSIIHSVGAHTYGEAQEMLDDPNHPEQASKRPRAPARLSGNTGRGGLLFVCNLSSPPR